MTANLAMLFPDPKVLLELEPEDLGAVLLEIWGTIAQNNLCIVGSFVVPFQTSDFVRQHGNLNEQIMQAVAEAFSWLEREGFIVRDPHPGNSHWYLRTRRGLKVRNRTDLIAYRQASLLPRSLLHPTIEAKCWPLFLRGDYDTAVFQAFKSVEVAVREAAELGPEDIGVTLMRKAFHPETGPLRDQSAAAPGAERQGLMDLFAGAIGHAKNPQSHRVHTIGLGDAARLLLFASYLCDVVALRRLFS